MLYDCWRATVRQRGAEWALWEPASGRRWSFRDLDAEVERLGPPSDPILFPSGRGPDFFLRLLQGWRWERPVCPLESGQAPPALEPLPPGSWHVKTTSASTGSSRAILFRPEQLLADVRQIQQTMGLRPEWPNLAVVSLAHSYGFSNLVLPLAVLGIPLVLADSPLPESVAGLLKQLPAATLAAVPALWNAWSGAGVLERPPVLAISAGAPLPLPLEQSVHQTWGLKIHNFYGASECGGIAYDATASPRSDPCDAGEPLRGVELETDEGELLLVRSSAVGECYWPGRDPLGPEPGVYRAADLVRLRDGRCYLAGRAGDLINVAGRKVSPESVERALMEHPSVRQCVVFGVPQGDARHEQIVACLASAASPETLRQFLQSRLPAWQVPRAWWILPELAVNSRGKLSRQEWRKRFLEERS